MTIIELDTDKERIGIETVNGYAIAFVECYYRKHHYFARSFIAATEAAFQLRGNRIEANVEITAKIHADFPILKVFKFFAYLPDFSPSFFGQANPCSSNYYEHINAKILLDLPFSGMKPLDFGNLERSFKGIHDKSQELELRVFRRIAGDPNVDYGVLLGLMKIFPSIVLKNPALDLLTLERPDWPKLLSIYDIEAIRSLKMDESEKLKDYIMKVWEEDMIPS